MTDQDSSQLFQPKVTVQNFMVKDIVSVTPETLIVDASKLLIEKNLNGLPVVSPDGKLVGIVTEYDLLSKGSMIHIPTFVKLLKDLELYRKDKILISDELKNMLSLKVKDVMNADPLTLKPDTPLEEAIQIFSEHHRVNPIPIIAPDKKLLGVLSRFDILKLYMPAHPDPFVARKEVTIERRVDGFMERFERQFILVKKSRTRLWLMTSLVFLVAGFIAALAFALRIQIKWNF